MPNMLKCSKCSKLEFKSQESLSRHMYECHCDNCTITTVSFQGLVVDDFFLFRYKSLVLGQTKIKIKREENGLPCLICKGFYNTRQNLKTHLNKSVCQKSLFVSTCETSQENDKPEFCFVKRDYAASVVDACGGLELGKNEQNELLKIVDAINLKPVCLINSDN